MPTENELQILFGVEERRYSRAGAKMKNNIYLRGVDRTATEKLVGKIAKPKILIFGADKKSVQHVHNMLDSIPGTNYILSTENENEETRNSVDPSKYQLCLWLMGEKGSQDSSFFTKWRDEIAIIAVTDVFDWNVCKEMVSAGAQNVIGLDTINSALLHQSLHHALQQWQVKSFVFAEVDAVKIRYKAGNIGTWYFNVATEKGNMFFDDVMLKMLGYEQPPAGWEFSEVLDLVHKEDRIVVKKAFVQAKTSGEDLICSCYLEQKNGINFVGQFRGEAVKDDTGNVVALQGVFINITDRKLDEVQNRLATLELNIQIDEKVKALQRSNRDLESFAHRVAHDVRAPLQNLIHYVAAIQLDDYYEDLNDRTKRYINRTEQVAYQTTELLDGLLTLADVKQHHMKCKHVEVTQIAYDLADSLTTSYGLEADAFIIPENLSVFADANLMRVLLKNLMSNAAKYSSKVVNPKIELGFIDVNSRPTFFIKDNGAGFDMDLAESLFMPFERLHGSKEFEGHGIGLSTVYEIVQLHKGKIWAKGELNKGATFYLQLPTEEEHRHGLGISDTKI